MGFYQSIADYYDDIFPLDKAQIDFVRASIPEPHQGKKILDIGCATGSLAVALGRAGFRVTAIDLDPAMVELASQKGRGLSAIAFLPMDMKDLPGTFAPTSFDAVLCLGNTLVHLKERAEVLSVCRAIRALLRDGGKFVLQILNYDYILTQHLPGLPPIENDRVRFDRLYGYNGDGSITFRTTLTVKITGAVVKNEVLLYPLTKAELSSALKDAGFTEIRFYGNFGKGPLTARSLPLVAEAW